MEVKFCSYNPSSDFNFYLWNEVILFQQLLHNHHARLLQLCKVAKTLHKLPWPCDNLVTTLQSCSKVATTIFFVWDSLEWPLAEQPWLQLEHNIAVWECHLLITKLTYTIDAFNFLESSNDSFQMFAIFMHASGITKPGVSITPIFRS